MSARILVALVALVAIAGCGNQSDGDSVVPSTEPPESDPTIVGVITELVPFEPLADDCIEPDPNADPDSPVSSDGTPFCSNSETAPLGTVLVEENPVASGDSKISFTVRRSTTLLNESAGSYDPLSFADLVDGATVFAWADGAVAESYPAQATAAAIVVRTN
jgi:hypothetical protein